MVDASLKAEAQALRSKGLAWAKIALSLGVNERTVYKWRERGEVSDPTSAAPVDGPPMTQDEVVSSLWSSLSRAARALQASETPAAAATTRALKTISDALDKLVMLKATIGADATANEPSLDAFREDLIRRLEALRAAETPAERLARLEAEAGALREEIATAS